MLLGLLALTQGANLIGQQEEPFLRRFLAVSLRQQCCIEGPTPYILTGSLKHGKPLTPMYSIFTCMNCPIPCTLTAEGPCRVGAPGRVWFLGLRSALVAPGHWQQVTSELLRGSFEFLFHAHRHHSSIMALHFHRPNSWAFWQGDQPNPHFGDWEMCWMGVSMSYRRLCAAQGNAQLSQGARGIKSLTTTSRLFSVIWGWGWYFGDADFCPATC